MGVTFALSFALLTFTAPQSEKSQWITAPAKNSANSKHAWFRTKEVVSEPSTGLLRIAANGNFILWVNGKKLSEGVAKQGYRVSLNNVLSEGTNVLCFEVENSAEKPALYVEGEIRGQTGKHYEFGTKASWRATFEKPNDTAWMYKSFQDNTWPNAERLEQKDVEKLKAISFSSGVLDRFDPAPGFVIDQIADPKITGSLVTLTWGNRGRLLVSQENSFVYSLIDDNQDGVYDRAIPYSDQIKNCQGLCQIGDVLFAVGHGPEGAGMYRLPDANHDDKADGIELVIKYKGTMGEHGPHSVVLSPDGWLFNNLGNHAWVPVAAESMSPVRDYYEGDLLRPRFEDPNGHAAGIPAPGGTVWRLTPNGKRWWLHTNGFRNAYDFAINSNGELFTFDSDMEWELGMPFYRPIRINHCTAGAEFGWRSNSAKWPSYFFDSLPSAVDIARGSPTGVMFYEHDHLPPKYRGSLIACDWSMGRILAVHLKSQGASFAGEVETLATGNPLNVVKAEIDRDGTIVFATGGRGTIGGVYRLRHAASQKVVSKPVDSVEALLRVPQFSANWSREQAVEFKRKHVDQWPKIVIDSAKKQGSAEKIRAMSLLAQLGPRRQPEFLAEMAKDRDAKVRAFAILMLSDESDTNATRIFAAALEDADPVVQRRALEAFVRSGIEAPVDLVVRALASNDRWLQFAARLTLERIPIEKWQDKILSSKVPTVTLHGLLAMQRVKQSRVDAKLVFDAVEKILSIPNLEEKDLLAATRIIQLTLLESGKTPAVDRIAKLFFDRFPGKSSKVVDREYARLLSWLQYPGILERLLQQVETQTDHEDVVHYAICLAYVNTGWSSVTRDRLLKWYESTGGWEGGHSYSLYLANITERIANNFPANEVPRWLTDWKSKPLSARVLLGRPGLETIPGIEPVLVGIIRGALLEEKTVSRDKLLSAALTKLGECPTNNARVALYQLFEDEADLRSQIARSLCAKPANESLAYLVRALATSDKTTGQLCLNALKKMSGKSDRPDDIRSVILAGLRLGEEGGGIAVSLLAKWSGAQEPKEKDVRGALAYYQKWYREKFPTALPAELPAQKDDSKFKFNELLAYIEKCDREGKGDAKRGKLAFTKANCIKCHRFGSEGEGVGPDLSSVRRRFQRREILESMLFPSQVVSDQYRSVTVSTTEGLVHTGMPISEPKAKILVLLMSDTKKLKIPAEQVEQTTPSKLSVMPDDVLNQLTKAEIADLFAFLETSKTGPTLETSPPSGGTGTGKTK